MSATSSTQACAQRRPSIRAVAGTLGRGAFLSAWYTVVTAPDANAFLHRALTSHTGGAVWRALDGTRSVLQFATLPLAAVATALGRTRIARISAFAVFANPPTFLLTALIAHDAANFLFRQFQRAANTVMRRVPLLGAPPSETTAQNETGTGGSSNANITATVTSAGVGGSAKS